MRGTATEDFFSKVDLNGPVPEHCPELGRCHVWTAYRQKGGYGVVRFNGKTELAHRVAFSLAHGRWPEPCALHHCDNPACVNEEHLFEGTRRDNAHDMCAKGRHGKTGPKRGERHFASKISDAQIKLMCAEYAAGGVTHKQLAERYGMHRVSVDNILNGKRRASNDATRSTSCQQ
jgi:hypothetical protein